MKKLFTFLLAVFTSGVAMAVGDGVATAAPGNAAALRKAPAWKSAQPESTMILGAARAGARIIGVGARGMVLLSDDDGAHWRQASQVPVRTTLTAVTFSDERNGWAVGHNGTIVATTDGGDSWSIQRFDAATDQPLFSVCFLDKTRGVAVGLWSLVLTTSDAGATWRPVSLPKPPDGGKADRNLLKVFSDSAGALYVAAERGTVLRSTDAGTTWTYHDTGYAGSFWAGAVATNGDIFVAGLRGTLYRSRDHGQTWQRLESGTKSSLTDMAVSGNEVVAVGLDGAVVRSADQGGAFVASQREDRSALTAIAPKADGAWVMFSKQGLVKP